MKLYIIGNGFDLAHGTPSSYYKFKEYVKANDRELYRTLEQYINVDDFWGDFEGNLSRLSREHLMIAVDTMADCMIDCYDESDNDFSYANFYGALELGTEAINTIINNIETDFQCWITTLQPASGPHLSLDPNALYINFNYTEFLETLYGIPRNKILYIHGDRRDSKDTLILGHGDDPADSLQQWIDTHKSDPRYQHFRYAKKGRRYRNDDLIYLAYFADRDYTKPGRYKTRQAIATAAMEQIEGYYIWTYKKTEAVLQHYSSFFQELSDIDEITVMGHSLSPVDRPYFKRILEVNKAKDHLIWNISWFSDKDKTKIQEFADSMGISKNNISLFRLD